MAALTAIYNIFCVCQVLTLMQPCSLLLPKILSRFPCSFFTALRLLFERLRVIFSLPGNCNACNFFLIHLGSLNQSYFLYTFIALFLMLEDPLKKVYRAGSAFSLRAESNFAYGPIKIPRQSVATNLCGVSRKRIHQMPTFVFISSSGEIYEKQVHL